MVKLAGMMSQLGGSEKAGLSERWRSTCYYDLLESAWDYALVRAQPAHVKQRGTLAVLSSSPTT